FYSYSHTRHPHSFPTRRSSDLAFVSAGKLQKNIWLIILILAALFSAAGAWQYVIAFLIVGGAKFMGIGMGIFSIAAVIAATIYRSEEHTSELQSRENLVCRLLL